MSKKKRPNINKLRHIESQLIKSIAGCYGWSECQEAHLSLKAVRGELDSLLRDSSDI